MPNHVSKFLLYKYTITSICKVYLDNFILDCGFFWLFKTIILSKLPIK